MGIDLTGLVATMRLADGAGIPATAVALASSGVPVFPCVPGEKRPLTRHGFLDATTDPEQVTSWWARWPAANLAFPTGQVSGVVVVDVDVHHTNGHTALHQARSAGLIPDAGVEVGSPSGGTHLYYPATDWRQPCWQAAQAGIDFRGDGGYIICPPSTTPAGTYRLIQAAVAGQTEMLDSVGLRDFLNPPAPARPLVKRDSPAIGGVERLAGWVARLGEGERNRGLFWAACRLAETGTPPGDALDALTPAATTAGLSQREAVTTIRSAYRTTTPQPVTQPQSASSQPAPFRPCGRAATLVRGLA